MDIEIHVPTPKTPTRRPETSRDIRLQYQTLYDLANFTVYEIALQVNLSVRQVYYALEHRITPQKPKAGRKHYIIYLFVGQLFSGLHLLATIIKRLFGRLLRSGELERKVS
jgi:hypothetical protein